MCMPNGGSGEPMDDRCRACSGAPAGKPARRPAPAKADTDGEACAPAPAQKD